MFHEDLIGTLAATLTTISFLPQVIKVIRTKKTADISLLMYVIFTLGVALWAVYGVMLESWPMIIANIVTFALVLVVLYHKIRHVMAGGQ